MLPVTFRTLAILLATFMTLASSLSPANLVDERVSVNAVEIAATFNRPGRDGEGSSRLEDRIIDLVSRAASGSSVYVSIYTFRRTEVAEALLEAQQRGVEVRVVVDNKSLDSDNQAISLLTEGGKGRPPLHNCDGPCVKICRFGCHGFHINHNKFIALSRLDDGTRWVVAQSSANFTRGQHHHYNDLIVIKHDRDLYSAFVNYFNDLRRGRWAPTYYRQAEGASPVSVHFFPRLIGPDPVAEILDGVICTPNSLIRVAHSRFESFRKPVARRIKQLADEGCDVRLILRDEPDKNSPGSAVVELLDDYMTVLPYKDREGETHHNSLHTKLILIDAPLDDSSEPRHIVLTGSHNLSITSLRFNDEVLLQIENEAVFDAYHGFWKSILNGS